RISPSGLACASTLLWVCAMATPPLTTSSAASPARIGTVRAIVAGEMRPRGLSISFLPPDDSRWPVASVTVPSTTCRGAESPPEPHAESPMFPRVNARTRGRGAGERQPQNRALEEKFKFRHHERHALTYLPRRFVPRVVWCSGSRDGAGQGGHPGAVRFRHGQGPALPDRRQALLLRGRESLVPDVPRLPGQDAIAPG